MAGVHYVLLNRRSAAPDVICMTQSQPHCLIQTTCPDCGDVEVDSRALTLNLYPKAPERNNYIYRCPSCVDDVQYHCSVENAQRLYGRVRVEVIDLPDEALEERPDTPLTWDEVLDFALALPGM